MNTVSKSLIFSDKTFNLSCKTPNSLVVFNQSNKLILKFSFKNFVFNSCTFYNFSNTKNSTYGSFFDTIINKFLIVNYGHYLNFGKLYMIGLGFKNFVLNNKLYILVGDCNYIIFSIPNNLKIFCRRNQIYVLSANFRDVFDFISLIKSVKKANFYKGKGVLQFKNFKFTKLKVGKKQRFM
jgi:ribosomal protein L6P/L9E